MKNPIILFDGVCNLCNGSINLILKRDKAGVFRFAALQSDAGREQLKRFNLDKRPMTSVVLVEGNRHFEKSEAALRILKRTGLALQGPLSPHASPPPRPRLGI